MNVKDLFEKLGVKVRVISLDEMEKDGADKGIGNNNQLAFYDLRKNEITLSDKLPPGFEDKSEYIGLHELVHWDMAQDPEKKLLQTFQLILAPHNAIAHNELAAESGADKLLRDRGDNSEVQFIAQRIDDIIRVFHVPIWFADDAIDEGEAAAADIEKRAGIKSDDPSHVPYKYLDEVE